MTHLRLLNFRGTKKAVSGHYLIERSSKVWRWQPHDPPLTSVPLLPPHCGGYKNQRVSLTAILSQQAMLLPPIHTHTHTCDSPLKFVCGPLHPLPAWPFSHPTMRSLSIHLQSERGIMWLIAWSIVFMTVMAGACSLKHVTLCLTSKNPIWGVHQTDPDLFLLVSIFACVFVLWVSLFVRLTRHRDLAVCQSTRR